MKNEASAKESNNTQLDFKIPNVVVHLHMKFMQFHNLRQSLKMKPLFDNKGNWMNNYDYSQL